MEHHENEFETTDGIKIYYQSWHPTQEPKAVIQIAHGLAEHSSRYLNVVNKLVPNGYIVYANDHRGHGKSGGTRGYVNSFNDYVNDLKQFTTIIADNEKNLPIFLLGHSMGSFISIHYASSNQDLFKGLILSGTGTQAGEKINFFLKFMVKLLSKMAPKGKINSGLSEYISRDPEVVKAYQSDPMVFPFVTYRLGHELMKAIGELPKKISTIKLPILFQSGGDDKLVSGASDLFKFVTAEDKTLKIYDGYYHEVYNEPEKEREIVLEDLKQWLDSHL